MAAIVQEIKFVSSGINQVNTQLQSIEQRLSRLGTSLNNVRVFQDMNQQLKTLNSTSNQMLQHLEAHAKQTNAHLQNVTNQLSKLGQQASKTSNTLQNLRLGEVRDIGKNVNFSQLQQDVERFSRGLISSNNHLRQMASHIERMKELQNLLRTDPTYSREIAQVYGTRMTTFLQNGDLSHFVRLQDQINQRLGNTGGMLSNHVTMSRTLHGVWRGLAAAAGQIWLSWGQFAPLMTGLAPALATLKSLSAQREFGWQMTQVGAALEVGDTKVKELSNSILALGGGQYTQGPIKMADALRVLAQAGLQANEALAAMPSVLNLAMVAGTSDEDAALFAAGMRHPFGLFDQQSLQAGIDQTAKAAAVSQTSIEQMMQSMKQAAPAASKFGLSVTDVSTALAVLARVNITGSAGGTAFKNLLTDLGGRTAKSQKALKELGLSAYDASGMVKPFTQIIAELQDKFRGLDDKTKQQWMRSFLDERGMRAADVLLNMTTEDFRSLHEEIRRGAENMGYTSVQAARLGETSEGAFRRMKAAWETTFVSIGQGVESPYKDTLRSFTDLANNSNVQNSLQLVAKGFLAVAQGGAAVLSLLTHLTPAFMGLAAAAGVMGGGTLLKMAAGFVASRVAMLGTITALQTIGTTFTMVTARYGLMAGMMATTRAAATALWGVLAANPLGALALAVGAVATYFAMADKKVETFADKLRKLPQDLGAVKTEVYAAFNEHGLGLDLDRLLGIKGNATYDVKRGVKGVTDKYVLDTQQTYQAFAGNLQKINEVVSLQLQTLSGSLKDAHASNTQQMMALTSQASDSDLQQAVLLKDRKQSLLQAQLDNLDKHLASQENLSKQDAELRMSYEKAVYDNAVELMTLRTEMAARQLEEIRIKATQEMGFLDKIWSNLTASDHYHQLFDKYTNYTPQTESERLAKGLADSGMYTPQAAYEKVFGKLDLDTLQKQALAFGNKEFLQYIKNEIAANPEKSAAAAKDNLNEINKLKLKLRDTHQEIPKYVDEMAKVYESAIKLANAHVQQRTRKLTERSQVQRDDAKIAELSGKLEKEKKEKQPLLPTSYTTKTKTYNPYSPIESKILSEEQKAAYERAKDAVARQRKLLGFALDVDLKAFADAIQGMGKIDAAKQADEKRKQVNALRKRLLSDDLSPSDRQLVDNDIRLLENEIKSLSAKGVVDLGKSVSKLVTTTKTIIDAAESTVKTGQANVQAATSNSSKPVQTVGNGRMGNLFLDPQNHGISSYFGPRVHPVTHNPNGFHSGVDYRAAVGTPLIAPFSGKVIENRFQMSGKTGWGNTVVIQSPEGVKYRASHMQHLSAIKVGQAVQAGQVIGHSGATGGVTGPHLDAMLYNAYNEILPINQFIGKSLSEIAHTRGGRKGKPFRGNVGTVSAGGMVTSEASNRRGQTVETTETTEFIEKLLTARNTEDGARYKAILQKAQHDADKEVAMNANQIALATTVKDEEHLLTMKEKQLELAKSMGMLTDDQYQSNKADLELERFKFDQYKQLVTVKSQGVYSEQELAAYATLQADELQRKLDLMKQVQIAQAASKDWRTGVGQAFSDLTNEATDYAAFAKKQVNAVSGGIINMFENLATTGKLKFKDMTASILSDLAKIYMRMAVMNLISSIGSSFLGGSSGNAMMGMNNAMITSSRGNVFSSSGLMAFASGGVVRSPTYFGFGRGGRGLMGEQGAEAVMPLSRMPNGDLGVAIQGTGGGVVVNAPVTVQVTVNSDGSSDSEISQSEAKQMGNAISVTVQQEVAKMLRPNGMIYNAMRGVR